MKAHFVALTAISVSVAVAWQTEANSHAKTRAELETMRITAQLATQARQAKEQELTDAQARHAQEVQAMQASVDTARAAAGSAATRLRGAVAQAVSGARAQCADTGTAGVGEAAGDTLGLLADVLGRADERAGKLAELADRQRIAGLACENAYAEAVKATKP